MSFFRYAKPWKKFLKNASIGIRIDWFFQSGLGTLLANGISAKPGSQIAALEPLEKTTNKINTTNTSVRVDSSINGKNLEKS